MTLLTCFTCLSLALLHTHTQRENMRKWGSGCPGYKDPLPPSAAASPQRRSHSQEVPSSRAQAWCRGRREAHGSLQPDRQAETWTLDLVIGFPSESSSSVVSVRLEACSVMRGNRVAILHQTWRAAFTLNAALPVEQLFLQLNLDKHLDYAALVQ